MLTLAFAITFPLMSVNLPKTSYSFPTITSLGSASTVITALSFEAVISLNSDCVLASIPVLSM